VAALQNAAYRCFNAGRQQMAAASRRLHAALCLEQRSKQSEWAAADEEAQRALAIEEGRLLMTTL